MMSGTYILSTPIGPLTLVQGGDGVLQAVEFRDHRLSATGADKPAAETDSPPPPHLLAAFTAYFAGDLHALQSLPAAAAGTPFEQRVWAALRQIPPGRTLSYGELARALGEPGASRAVGAANGRNPLAIIVPCHRVIGADGSLTGYAGGLFRKEWLLRHEGWHPRQERML